MEILQAIATLIISLLILLFAWRMHIKYKIEHLIHELDNDLNGLYNLSEQKLEILIATIESISFYADEETDGIKDLVAEIDVSSLNIVDLNAKVEIIERDLMKVIDNHPEVERNQQINDLRDTITNINSQIQEQKNIYNENVKKYNKKIKKIINRKVARRSGFQELTLLA